VGWTGFNPLSLFAGGIDGFLFDQLDPARTWTPPGSQLLYTDTGGTTAVTTSGDLVALFKDRSGNGRDASQGTAGFRPQWTSAAVPYLLYAGTDDRLAGTLAPAPAGMTLAACWRPTAAVIMNVMGVGEAGNTRCALGMTGGGLAAAAWGAHTVNTINIAGSIVNSDVVLLFRVNGSTEELWKNGTLGYSGTPSGTSGSTQPLFLGALNNNGSGIFNPMTGRIYRAVAIQQFLSDAHVLPLMQWLGAGVVSF
jgi:hypothetical protein